MKRILKVLLGIVGLLVIGVILTGTYMKVFLPNVSEPPEIKVEQSTDRIERGRYLAHHVTICMDCHSTRDWSQFAGPLTGNLGGGGERFGKEMGFPGTIYAANITPYNLGTWTDGEIFRAITTGVNKDGKALFPVMPYHNYGKMDREDILSIIAYLRTLKPIDSKTLEHELDFPVNFIVNTLPGKPNFQSRPDENDKLRYGAYLVNAAACGDCHNKNAKGEDVEGNWFGGGMEFRQKAGIVRVANITPNKENGIGNWTMNDFVKRFKLYADSNYNSKKLTPDDLNTPMPWIMYSGMKDSDLEAIYIYLQSLKPVNNPVIKFEKNP